MHFRWACNKRFRNAMTTFADNLRRASPWALASYRERHGAITRAEQPTAA